MWSIPPAGTSSADARHELSAEQLRVLRAVARLQGATVEELAVELGGPPRTLRRNLRRLTSDGRLERVWRAPGQGRRPGHVLEVTWHGMATLAHPVVEQLQTRRTA